jgi:hypothetical protein
MPPVILAFIVGGISGFIGCVVGILPLRIFNSPRFMTMIANHSARVGDGRRAARQVGLLSDMIGSVGMGLGAGVAVALAKGFLSSHYEGIAVYVGGFLVMLLLVRAQMCVGVFRSLLVASAIFGLVVGGWEMLGW